jgi:hypothetical protein
LSFNVAHYRKNEGYFNSWFDVEFDQGEDYPLWIRMPNDTNIKSDLYFLVETYPVGLYPKIELCLNYSYPAYSFKMSQIFASGHYEVVANYRGVPDL